MEANNKRILKNTLFLYFRMMLIMAVTLYTSRVTLQVLGIDDYGIYQTVAGAVTFLAFISNALGSGTSRFIIFEMGKEEPQLDKLFSTVRVAHIFIGLIIAICGELIGLWLLKNKLMIPVDRLNAAIFSFHFSILAIFFKITQVPYNAIILAHEKMNIFAYISIFEVILNLAIVFALRIFSFDKLKIYSVLVFFITAFIMCIYKIYCRKTFAETRAKLSFDKDLFKGVATFSGWNLLTSSAGSLANQGVTLVTNMFFAPSVVTIRSLALRINDILNQFVGNFQTAINPQIVKKYAANDFEGSKKLALISTQYTYYLMLIIVLPLFFLAEPMLKIWLGDFPEELIPFVKIALIQGLFQAIDTSLYVPIYAKGQIRENAIISPLFDSLQLPVIFILFKIGYPPITLAWVGFAAYAILGVIVKPFMVHIIVNYDYFNVIKLIGRCLIVTIISALIPFFFSIILDCNSVLGFSMIFLVSIISVVIAVWIFGTEKYIKNILLLWFRGKLGGNNGGRNDGNNLS